MIFADLFLSSKDTTCTVCSRCTLTRNVKKRFFFWNSIFFLTLDFVSDVTLNLLTIRTLFDSLHSKKCNIFSWTEVFWNKKKVIAFYKLQEKCLLCHLHIPVTHCHNYLNMLADQHTPVFKIATTVRCIWLSDEGGVGPRMEEAFIKKKKWLCTRLDSIEYSATWMQNN